MTTPDPDARFYEEIRPFEAFPEVANPAVYSRVPDSWWVLITDVRGSTKAIEAGRYKDVNALGVSTIMAVLNSIKDVQFPFVFGGDGATLVVPGTHVEKARTAAAAAIRLAQDAFQLELRAGLVPVSELSAAGHQVRVGRFKASPYITLAMFEGGGLALAEKLIKDPASASRYAIPPADTADWELFSGFECRWNPIRSSKGHILSLLVVARDDDKDTQRNTYRRVLEGIERASHAGADSLRPVGPSTLSLNPATSSYGTEARMRTGTDHGLRFQLYRIKVRLLVALATFLMRNGLQLQDFNGARYKDEVSLNTDFRKFDDTLRMVIDVTDEEDRAIRAYLESERATGAIAYGTHQSDAALMTCLVSDYAGNHVHFVDGSNGGYALAARELKDQLKQARKPS